MGKLGVNFAASVFADRHSEEAVDAVAVAGDEFIHFIAEPVHAGELEDEPERKAERQFAEHAAYGRETAYKLTIGHDEVHLPHRCFIIERGITAIDFIPIVDIQEFDAM